jgi:hypothetical protein
MAQEEVLRYRFRRGGFPLGPDHVTLRRLGYKAAGHDRIFPFRRMGSLDLSLQLGRQPLVVIIQKGDPSAASLSHANVSRFCRAHRLRKSDDPKSGIFDLSQCLCGLLIRTVDNDDDLDGTKGLIEGATDCSLNETRSVPSRNDSTH